MLSVRLSVCPVCSCGSLLRAAVCDGCEDGGYDVPTCHHAPLRSKRRPRSGRTGGFAALSSYGPAAGPGFHFFFFIHYFIHSILHSLLPSHILILAPLLDQRLCSFSLLLPSLSSSLTLSHTPRSPDNPPNCKVEICRSVNHLLIFSVRAAGPVVDLAFLPF